MREANAQNISNHQILVKSPKNSLFSQSNRLRCEMESKLTPNDTALNLARKNTKSF